uniref:Uncharacterized protein n=1 Tax=Rhizophora mucronata TaxID=61149 RepID=A0A2P2QI00_RHIMU
MPRWTEGTPMHIFHTTTTRKISKKYL